jgi:HEAT repeat protein
VPLRTFLEKHRVIKPQSHRLFVDWKGSDRALGQWALEELGPDAKPAVPALVQMLGMRGPTTNDLNLTAGTAYILLPKMAPASIPPLIDSLSSTDLQVFALAAGALGEIGPRARAAIPVVQRRLGDTNVMVRVGAARALGQLGADPSLFMPAVVESLRDPDYTFLDYSPAQIQRPCQRRTANPGEHPDERSNAGNPDQSDCPATGHCGAPAALAQSRGRTGGDRQ